MEENKGIKFSKGFGKWGIENEILNSNKLE